MKLTDALLERTNVYRLWQAPFAAGKFAPILKHNDLRNARRVLDVGCGPGTNTAWFRHADYLGIDINPRYIESARRRTGRRFEVADVTQYPFDAGAKFDFVLVNSFLHHVPTPDVRRILKAAASALAPGGKAHVLDLVLPEGPSLARFLAEHDRGHFARPLSEWRALLDEAFDVEVFEPYPLGVFGVPLWRMVYCRGGAKP